MTMPTGPKGERRPADVVKNAIHIAKIATGEEVDEVINAVESPTSKGGNARAEKLDPARRSEIARKAAQKRWATD